MNEFDHVIARAAPYLVSYGQPELATKLLSCHFTSLPVRSVSGLQVTITVPLVGPRDIFELLWATEEWLVSSKDGIHPDDSIGYYALAFTEATGTYDSKYFRYYVEFQPSYGAANRSATEQTELYMYVFGEDPIGQQVQVLDVGPHSAPTRQLIVSPVPVLPVTDLARDGKLCFVVMPFAAPFRPVYDHAITPAVTKSGLTCRRGDDISLPGAILSQIWQSLLQARLVISDVSGANGNVLYELGLAHVLGHEVIILTQDISDVPFDLRHQRIITYRLEGDGLDALQASLAAAIQSSLAVKR